MEFHQINDPAAEQPDGRELEAIEVKQSLLCVHCGHTKEAHWDRYGCQIEGPDVWVDGENCGGLMASGPCGCKNYQAERVVPSWPSPLLRRTKLDVPFDDLEATT